MKHNGKNVRAGKLRKTRETRAMLASRFRVLCADAGLSIDAVAQTLHVTPRTVRYWFSGKSAVPYAAYKLVRVMRWFELPQKGFEGWCMHSGKLWTPEGHPIAPEDGGWWSLLVRQARCFRTLYQRSADFERALMMLTAQGLQASDAPRTAGASTARGGPPGGAPGRAERGPNLLLGHFGTRKGQRPGVSLEKPLRGRRVAVSQDEKQELPVAQCEKGVIHG